MKLDNRLLIYCFDEWLKLQQQEDMHPANWRTVQRTCPVTAQWIKKNLNVIGYMTSAIACYNQTEIIAHSMIVKDFNDFIDATVDKKLFIYKVLFVPNIPVIGYANSHTSEPIMFDYPKITEHLGE